jgi:hypothetical protein
MTLHARCLRSVCRSPSRTKSNNRFSGTLSVSKNCSIFSMRVSNELDSIWPTQRTNSYPHSGQSVPVFYQRFRRLTQPLVVYRRIRNADVDTAIDVLVTGEYQRLPKMIDVSLISHWCMYPINPLEIALHFSTNSCLRHSELRFQPRMHSSE